MKDVLTKIYEYSLEEIMGERFGKYSKYIIQDRAIPDVRDGLKPVQRRILYAMHMTKNTYDKPYNKSASAVGEVIGKYHPHGDTSIYDAMVRMSQGWKMRMPHIDMQGNNGSIDGDSPAAMRYTEARLSKLSNELLRDIEKDTIVFTRNFDDKHLEPTVLPCHYPNLLVNGTTGISAGYATNIPSHNLGEVIDATIYRIDNPNSRLETLMNIIKGPDFPTGGIIEGIDGIRNAYETGRGRIIVKAKTIIEKNKISITEIPYETLKINIVKKIEEIRIDKKIDGIVECRDDSDKDGLLITIELKKDAKPELILNYLFKNTDLQVSYSFNMIAIVNRRPKLLGLFELLDAYINHKKEVVRRQSEFDLSVAEKEMRLAEGLIKAISILDEVIALIRASKNKSDARVNLVERFKFTEEQAEYILMLQLYRLSNSDIVALNEKIAMLQKIINMLKDILNDESKLNGVIKEDLRRIKKEYARPRISEIREEIEEIKIDNKMMISKEEVIVVVTKEGYIKRVPKRSYNEEEDTALKENDYVIGLYNMNTLDTLLVFTNMGNYLYIPVHEIPELKWKELGKHVSNIITIESSERVISSMPVYDFNDETYITVFSKLGMVKRTKLSEFMVQRYSKAMNMMKLKSNDEVISIDYSKQKDVFVATRNGYGLWYEASEISVVGIKASGVKAINLKSDEVVSGYLFNQADEYITVITDKGTGKRLKLDNTLKGSRANRGVLLMKEIKSNPSKIVSTYIKPSKTLLGIVTDTDISYIKLNEAPIMDRYSNGSYVVKNKTLDTFVVTKLISKDMINEKAIEEKIKKEEPTIEMLDERISTIDILLEDIDNS